MTTGMSTRMTMITVIRTLTGITTTTSPADFGRAFAIGIALNGAYVVGEAVYGFLANSLALLGRRRPQRRRRGEPGPRLARRDARPARALHAASPTACASSSILAALANAVLLALVTGAIAWEAVLRLMQPQPAAGAD